MVTHRALLFFHPMFRDPESLGRQVDDLTSLWYVCRLGAQIVLAVLTTLDRMNEDFIRCLDLPQVMSTMTCLPTRFLAALCAQALGGTNKTIRGGRQTAIMAIFGLLSFEGFDVLLQSVDQPFEDFHTLLLRANSDDGLFESFAQVLIRLLCLFQCFVFASQGFKQGCFLGSQLFEFFIPCHAATLADGPSSCNCIALLNSYPNCARKQFAILEERQFEVGLGSL